MRSKPRFIIMHGWCIGWLMLPHPGISPCPATWQKGVTSLWDKSPQSCQNLYLCVNLSVLFVCAQLRACVHALMRWQGNWLKSNMLQAKLCVRKFIQHSPLYPILSPLPFSARLGSSRGGVWCWSGGLNGRGSLGCQQRGIGAQTAWQTHLGEGGQLRPSKKRS